MSEDKTVMDVGEQKFAENRLRQHLTVLLKELSDLGQPLPPGEYTVEQLVAKIALAKARKAANQCGPTERRRGE